MKNSKLRRALLLVASAVLLVCVSVGATLAYLTAETGVVTNTFTIGDVAITLDEGAVYETDTDGFTAENNGRWIDREKNRVGEDDGNEYKLIPGRSYHKDPTVHVTAGSEDCYVFVKVENGFAAYEAANEFDTETTGGKTIADQMAALNWIAIENGSNIYCKCDANGTPLKNKANDELVVFEYFALKGDLTDADFTAASKAQITIEAYAIQSEGISATTAKAIYDLYAGQK